jgi:acyl-CoA thioesterase FadM
MSAAPPRYEAVYRVRFDEATPQGTLRNGALLGYVTDIAWLHSSALGFTREWYRERNLAWLVRAIEIEMLQAVRDGDEIRLTTRIGGYRKVMARRVSEILAADGTLVGTARVDWAMTDGTTAVRVPVEFTSVPGVEQGPFTLVRVAIPEAPADGAALDLVPRLRELDPMNHVNSGAYADWFDEAVTAAGGGRLALATPRRLRIEYVRSATPAAALRSQAWLHDGGYAWRLVDAGTGDEMAKGFLLGGVGGPDAGPSA